MTASQLKIVADMKRANALVNESTGVAGYQIAMVALALLARQFLREVEAQPPEREDRP